MVTNANWITVKDLLTFGFAAVGAVLGVINTIYSLDQRRVRLRVVPKSAMPYKGGILTNSEEAMAKSTPCIEVINLSSFPVTIAEIGFTLKNEPTEARAGIPNPRLFDKKPWPRRLEPRETVTGHLDLDNLVTNIDKAFARTDCGEVRFGDSPALKMIRKQLRAKEGLHG